jgi:signal transduction histidine kinase
MRVAIRPTVRLRLTLLYGGLFFAAGVVLIALTYGLVSRALEDREPPRGGPGEGQFGGPGSNPGGDRGEDGGGFAVDDGGTAGDGRTFEQQLADARQEERDAALNSVLTQGSVALAVTGAGALLLGWLVAGRALRPVQRITAHARRASQSTLADRIDLRGPPDELRELADTFDAMLDRLQAAFEAQRRFSAQASHELRTPLAIMRAEADVALNASDVSERERRLAEAVQHATDRSERLVDGLLALARSESTLRNDARVDLTELVGDVVGEQARVADQAGVELDLDLGDADVTVSGDRALLWRLVGNLVENAIRYNHAAGWARVSVGLERGQAVLRVENSGPRVAPAMVEGLFEPFRRGASGGRERPAGFGLGLAIARTVVLAHGGEIEAEAPPTGGLVVTARLPASDEESTPSRELPSHAAGLRYAAAEAG